MSEWKTIESVPRDETVVLLYCPESWDTKGVRVGWWHNAENALEDGWYENEWASHMLTDLYGKPTHWMPLPEPPHPSSSA